MRRITATDAKKGLGGALASLENDSLLIERNGKPAAMVFKAEDGKKMILSSYAHGTISRARAMTMLGYSWYGQLLDALADFGIARPTVPAEEREKMTAALEQLLRPLATEANSHESSLYERDYHAWLEEQARTLKGGQIEGLDVGNLIEEIEDLGRSEEAELQSAIEQALLHLAKLAYSPAIDQRTLWQTSVTKHRVEIGKRLRRSPGLQAKMDSIYREAWPDARKIAIAEMATHDEFPEIPAACPFSMEEVSNDDYWPRWTRAI